MVSPQRFELALGTGEGQGLAVDKACGRGHGDSSTVSGRAGAVVGRLPGRRASGGGSGVLGGRSRRTGLGDDDHSARAVLAGAQTGHDPGLVGLAAGADGGAHGLGRDR